MVHFELMLMKIKMRKEINEVLGFGCGGGAKVTALCLTRRGSILWTYLAFLVQKCDSILGVRWASFL